ncbi:hypothetical protein LguiA_000869 [Lonicera macranthoides]
MKKLMIPKNVIGFPISAKSFSADRSPKAVSSFPSTQCHSSPIFNYRKLNSVMSRLNKFGEKMDNFAQGIREHVRIGPKLTETVKGKLKLGARILQLGGVEKIFRQYFSVKEGEKLLKASQCYLSTTAGPIAGIFFISTDKVAFCSERSIKLSSPTGDVLRIHYKVSIPIRKIRRTDQSENVKKPSRKYI